MPSVLVVEDHNAWARLHENIFQRHGFTTKVATSGREAIDLVSSGNEFDVILINKYMPVMNGIEATMVLRSMDVKSLIVGVTADGEAGREVYMAFGLDECFDMPLKHEDVFIVIQLLNYSSSTDW